MRHNPSIVHFVVAHPDRSSCVSSAIDGETVMVGEGLWAEVLWIILGANSLVLAMHAWGSRIKMSTGSVDHSVGYDIVQPWILGTIRDLAIHHSINDIWISGLVLVRKDQ